MQANCKNGCIYCKLGTKERRDMTLYYVSPYINNYQNRKQTVNHIYIMYMYIITVISFSIYVGRIWTGLKPTSCPDKWKDYWMIGGNRPLVETSHLSLSSWLTMWSSMNYTHFFAKNNRLEAGLIYQVLDWDEVGLSDYKKKYKQGGFSDLSRSLLYKI